MELRLHDVTMFVVVLKDCFQANSAVRRRTIQSPRRRLRTRVEVTFPNAEETNQQPRSSRREEPDVSQGRCSTLIRREEQPGR